MIYQKIEDCHIYSLTLGILIDTYQFLREQDIKNDFFDISTIIFELGFLIQ